MKCIHCGTDSKYKERTNRICPKCRRKFVFEPRGLVLGHARHMLIAGIEPQPGVEQISLLDRFDDRGVRALEIQGCIQCRNPISVLNTLALDRSANF